MGDQKRLRILVVDDEDSFRGALRLTLESKGNEVTEADSGETALETIKEGQFDVIILDYLMERVSGLNVLQWMHEEKMDTPVIMLTGAGSENVAVEAMKLGAYDYVRKDLFDQRHLPILVNGVHERHLFKIDKERRERNIVGQKNQSDSMEQLHQASEFLAHFAATRLSILSSGLDELEPELKSNMPKELRELIESQYSTVKEELRLISILIKTLLSLSQFMIDRFKVSTPREFPKELNKQIRELQESARLSRG